MPGALRKDPTKFFSCSGITIRFRHLPSESYWCEKAEKCNQMSNQVERVHCPRWTSRQNSGRSTKLFCRRKTFFAAAAHDSPPNLGTNPLNWQDLERSVQKRQQSNNLQDVLPRYWQNSTQDTHFHCNVPITMGHCRRHFHLPRIVLHPNGLCDTCDIPETVEHFLMQCGKYAEARRKL